MEIDELREFCLALPAVTEDIKWEHLVFSVGDKMFCMATLEQPLAFSFKASDEKFEALGTRNGMMPAPYLARAKWVLVNDLAQIHSNELKTWIKESYELVRNKLPKKTRSELNI